MSLTFCPNCGNLLQLQEYQSSNALACSTCPYVYALQEPLVRTVPLVKKELDDVLGGKDAWKNVQKGAATCPKCSYHEAYFMEVQTRSADEPATIFYKCVSCGVQWKEG